MTTDQSSGKMRMPIPDLLPAVDRYLRISRTIAAYTHQNPARVLIRSLRIRFGYGLGIQDFWLYNLTEKQPQQWREYLTKNALTALQEQVNPPIFKELVTNKLLFYERCVSSGIATPPILGVVFYQEGLPVPQGLPVAKTAGELNEILLKYDGGQLILKSVRGVYGEGVLVISIRGGRIRDHCGNELPPESIIGHCVEHESSFLIQKFLTPDERLKPIMPGTALGTIRIVTILEPAGGKVRVPYAFMKIPTSGNITDNFYHGGTGNLLAGIDLSSGRIVNAWGASSPRGGCIVQVDKHPDSGTVLPNFPIPEWQQVLATARHAAPKFPEFRTLGWDVAVTSEGVCLLEANCNWDPDGPQITLDKGIRSEIIALFNAAHSGPAILEDNAAAPNLR